jgi:hypothetical protein
MITIDVIQIILSSNSASTVDGFSLKIGDCLANTSDFINFIFGLFKITLLKK